MSLDEQKIRKVCDILDVPFNTDFCIGGIVRNVEDKKGNIKKVLPLLVANGPYKLNEKGLINVSGQECPDVLGNLFTGRFIVERSEEVNKVCGQSGYTGGKEKPLSVCLPLLCDVIGVRPDTPFRIKDDEAKRVYVLRENGLFVKNKGQKGFPSESEFRCTFLYGELLCGKYNVMPLVNTIKKSDNKGMVNEL